jgi:hypothetical protein
VHLVPLSSSRVGYHRSQVHLLLLATFPHSTTAIPTPLCIEGRRQVAAPPATILMRHRCPESGRILASSCTAAMCLESTAIASAMGLTVERRLRSSSCLAATSSRTTPSHCYFLDPEPVALTPYHTIAVVPPHPSHAPVESSIR